MTTCDAKVENDTDASGEMTSKPEREFRLLLFSDLHLDAPFLWASPEAAHERRRMLRRTLGNITQLAIELQVDAICCGGDLYEHERFTLDTGEFLKRTFSELAPVPVFLAPGNHDWYGPASLYRQIDWSENVHVFSEDRLTPEPLVDGLTLWGGAHRGPANTRNFLEKFSVDRSGVHLALFHGSEQSGLSFQDERKIPHAPFRMEQVPDSGLHHVLLGHYHTPIDGVWHTYPGNPDPLEFGEQGKRGAVAFQITESGKVNRARHVVASSSVHDIQVELDSVTDSDQIVQMVASKLSHFEGFVRATLVGEIDPVVDIRPEDLKLEQLAPHLKGLVVRVGALSVKYDFEMLAKERTVRGQFVRDVLDAPDFSDEQRRRVLVTGLRALDGRADLEVQ